MTKINDVYGPDFVCPSVVRLDVSVMRQIARKAAENALFIPATKDGKAVSSHRSLKFEFVNPSPKKPVIGEDVPATLGVKAYGTDGTTDESMKTKWARADSHPYHHRLQCSTQRWFRAAS